MMLHQDQALLSAIAEGAVECVKEDGYCRLYRFTQAQRDFYQEAGGWYGGMSRCPAGITLYAGEKLAFDYNLFSENLDGASLDVSYGGGQPEEVPLTVSKGRLIFDGKGRDVRVYLPFGRQIGLRRVEAQGAWPQRKDRRIFCFGDSITQGFLARRQSSPYPYALAQAFDAQAYNFGISGFFFREGSLMDLDKLPAPQMVLLAYGTNDWWFEEDYRPHLDAMLAALDARCPQADVFILTPIFRQIQEERRKAGTLEDVREDIRRAVGRYPRMRVIEGQKLIGSEEYLTSDGTHPTDDGLKAMGQRLAAVLQTLCQE